MKRVACPSMVQAAELMANATEQLARANRAITVLRGQVDALYEIADPELRDYVLVFIHAIDLINEVPT